MHACMCENGNVGNAAPNISVLPHGQLVELSGTHRLDGEVPQEQSCQLCALGNKVPRPFCQHRSRTGRSMASMRRCPVVQLWPKWGCRCHRADGTSSRARGTQPFLRARRALSAPPRHAGGNAEHVQWYQALHTRRSSFQRHRRQQRFGVARVTPAGLLSTSTRKCSHFSSWARKALDCNQCMQHVEYRVGWVIESLHGCPNSCGQPYTGTTPGREWCPTPNAWRPSARWPSLKSQEFFPRLQSKKLESDHTANVISAGRH